MHLNDTRQVHRVPEQLLAYSYATQLLFGLVSVLNTPGFEFFYYYRRQIQIILIEPFVDVLVWIASVGCSSILVIWYSRDTRKPVISIGLAAVAMSLVLALLAGLLNGSVNVLIAYALFIVASFELAPLVALRRSPNATLTRSFVFFLVYIAAIAISSATHYAAAAFDPATQVGVFDARAELQLSFAPYAAVPWLCVAFLSSWAWVPLITTALKKAGWIRQAKEPTLNQTAYTNRPGILGRLRDSLSPRLLGALAVALFVGYYPYFHNPRWLVGTDALWRYYDPLLRINAGGLGQALHERYPALLAFLYVAQRLLNTSPYTVIKFLPAVIVLTMGLFAYWFLAAKNDTFGLVAILLSTLSFTTTIGLFSSILASWTGLVLWMAVAAFVAFREDQRFRVRDLLVVFVLSTLFLFIHPWTWGLFAVCTTLAAMLSIARDRLKSRLGFFLILMVALDGAVAFASLILLPGSQGWRELDTLRLYASALAHPQRLFMFWDALLWLTKALGLFFSPILILVSIVGVFGLMSPNTTPWRRRFILAWVFVSAIASVLAAPIGFNPSHPESSETQLWRVLFLTPFQLTAPFGIAWLASVHNPRTEQTRTAASAEQLWIPIVFAGGIASAFAPPFLRLLIMFVVLPTATMLILARSLGRESELLGKILLAAFAVLMFDYATRAVSQLLFDPNNHKPS